MHLLNQKSRLRLRQQRDPSWQIPSPLLRADMARVTLFLRPIHAV